MMVVSRHIKGLEAVGMALVLVSWGFSWASLERWTRAATQHEKAGSELLEARTHVQITANARLEAAVSRQLALRPPAAPFDGGWGSIELAWDSGEVRQRWLSLAFNDAFAVEELARRLVEVNNQYALVERDQLAKLVSSSGALSKSLTEAVAPAELSERAVPVPPIQAIDPAKAREIENALSKLALDAFTISHEMSETISSRRSSGFGYYGWAFAVGTMILIVAKLVDWRTQLRSTGSTLASTEPPQRPPNTRLHRTVARQKR